MDLRGFLIFLCFHFFLLFLFRFAKVIKERMIGVGSPHKPGVALRCGVGG